MTYTYADLAPAARITMLALSPYVDVWWPQLKVDTSVHPPPEVMRELRDLQYITITPDTDIEIIEIADRGWRWLIETVTAGEYPSDADDTELHVWAALAEVAQRARHSGRHFADIYRPSRHRWHTVTAGTRPSRDDLDAGSQLDHSNHEIDVRTKVADVFEASGPGDTVRALARLLAYAPRPNERGVDDVARASRADEDALIWGTPMTGRGIRRRWLARADDAARVWGTPLFGPDGLTRASIDMYAADED